MTWFRRGGQDTSAPPATPPDDGDSPTALRTRIFAMNRYINQNSGELPGEAVVDARKVTDTLREIVDTSDVRPLDVYAVLSVRATLDDYLPTTLQGYLAVDHDLRAVPRPSGATPAQSLIEQIEALQSSADSVLIAARNQDVDALMTQGSFLRTKFSGSDLDL
jgi:hypothetical protein